MQANEATQEKPETLEQALVRLDKVTRERDVWRASYERLRLELDLLKRRIYLAKAERIDTAQLEFEFAAVLAALNELASTPPRDDDGEETPKRPKAKPRGRRDLTQTALQEERVEITDPLFETLVAEGKAERIGFEESSELAWQRGGMRRLILARVKYRAVRSSTGVSEIETAPMPPEALPRCLAAPSLLAHVAIEKHCDGLPLNRIEDRFTRDGIHVDRGTMCRWLDAMGSLLGRTIVAAARAEAIQTAFCIATDATGVAIQPEPREDKKRQACRRGHYFVLIADRDHIFFEYTAKETSKVVSEMFSGFSGYVQADAKSVYDILFRKDDKKHPDPDDGDAVRYEVGCWSHCRTKFWEAAMAKSEVAREGLMRIRRIFEVDAGFRGKAPAQIKSLREVHLRPHLESFFSWVEAQYALVIDERGVLRSACGYAVRQKDALMRVLEDGRLVLENNRSERQLRKIAVGRKAWLFAGSDGHATSAGHLLSMIASARLHGLDPETYLRDIIRVLAQWPADRYIELAPKYWAATRARLIEEELVAEIGWLTIPPPLATSQQPAAN